MINQRESLLFRLEQDIAQLLVNQLSANQISLERASQIARFILAHIPETITEAQLNALLPTLDDSFIELADIVHKYLNEFDRQHKNLAIHQIEDLIKHKHFEQASDLAKQYFQRKYSI